MGSREELSQAERDGALAKMVGHYAAISVQLERRTSVEVFTDQVDVATRAVEMFITALRRTDDLPAGLDEVAIEDEVRAQLPTGRGEKE